MARTLRPLPCETVDGLRPPLAGFSYLKGADDFPFQADATGYSPTNAWWLADAAFLVYGDAAFVNQAFRNSPLPDQGFRLDWLGTPDHNRGMVLASDTALVVVFRGTRLQVHNILDSAEVVLINQSDLVIDASCLFKSAQAGGRAHAGFVSAFGEIRERFDAVVSARQPNQRLWLTGHSLGGALATLAAAHVGRTTVQGLYTYGAPRVGDADFAAAFFDQPCFRVVHRNDWIAAVPPEFLGYQHAGSLQRISGAPPRSIRHDLAIGLQAIRETVLDAARNLPFKTGDIPFQIGALADHAPIWYSTLLWNALADATPPRPPEG